MTESAVYLILHDYEAKRFSIIRHVKLQDQIIDRASRDFPIDFTVFGTKIYLLRGGSTQGLHTVQFGKEQVRKKVSKPSIAGARKNNYDELALEKNVDVVKLDLKMMA